MRYLGIDYGDVKIGLAVSDEASAIAFPHATVGDIGGVVGVIHREGIGCIIIGLPVALDGAETAAAARVRRFARRLAESVQLPMAFENEVFTTTLAEAHSAAEHADAAAAAVILQSYLDRTNTEGQKTKD